MVVRMWGWDRRTKAVVVAGAAAGLAIAFLLGRVGQGSAKPATPNVPPVVAVAPRPPVAPPEIPTTTAPPATVETKPAAEKAEDDDGKDDKEAKDEKEPAVKADSDSETAGKAKPARVAPAAAAVESKKMLADGERLLRAERFAEAREIFQKLTKAKKERGPALVGLAEVSFQEKKYADAARAAELAAERGGGVKARVLLGDAHFRLAHYKDAAKAYEDALKIDPGNASAKSGLALANKRM
jgi:tetratricopeptide (TPR) repeat protein